MLTGCAISPYLLLGESAIFEEESACWVTLTLDYFSTHSFHIKDYKRERSHNLPCVYLGGSPEPSPFVIGNDSKLKSVCFSTNFI